MHVHLADVTNPPLFFATVISAAVAYLVAKGIDRLR